jgi:hypothetical protein
VRPDGGVRPDAGFDAGLADAGDPPVGDAGTDAGVADAGNTSTLTRVAFGTESLTPAVNRGCGCGATPGLDLLGLVAMLGFLRRRR